MLYPDLPDRYCTLYPRVAYSNSYTVMQYNTASSPPPPIDRIHVWLDRCRLSYQTVEGVQTPRHVEPIRATVAPPPHTRAAGPCTPFSTVHTIGWPSCKYQLPASRQQAAAFISHLPFLPHLPSFPSLHTFHLFTLSSTSLSSMTSLASQSPRLDDVHTREVLEGCHVVRACDQQDTAHYLGPKPALHGITPALCVISPARCERASRESDPNPVHLWYRQT